MSVHRLIRDPLLRVLLLGLLAWPVLAQEPIGGAGGGFSLVCEDGEVPVFNGSSGQWECGAGGGGGGGTPGGSDGQAQYRVNATTFGGFPLLWNGTVMTFPGSRVRVDANGDLEILNSSFQIYSPNTSPVTIGAATHQGTINLRGGNTLSVAGITSAVLVRGNTTNTPGTVLGVQAPAAAVRGLVIQGAASQSANLFEFRNSANAFLTGFDPAGNFSGTAAALGADPTDCAGGLFATSIAASGNLGCIAVDWTAIANKPSTFAPSAHAASHAENAADEILGENLGTACPIGQVWKSDGAGGVDCADDDNSGGASSATESAEGVAEIATQGEVDAGTDDQRFITPLKLEESAQLAGKADAAHTHALADLSDVSGKSGNTEEVATVSGAKTQSKQLAFDADGNVIASAQDIGGAGTGATQISELTDLQVSRDADTGILNIAAGRARFGNTLYAISAATVELDDASTTGDAELFIAQNGTLTVAHTIGMTVVCTGCTASDTGAGIPVTAIPLARWSSASSGVWDASGTERRAFSNGIIPVNGAGVCSQDTGGIRTFLLCFDALTEQADPADADKIVFERESDDGLRKMTIAQLKTEVADGTGTDDQNASEVPFTPAGNLAGSNMQAIGEELDAEKAPVSHTHTESQISDLQHRTAGPGLVDNGDALELAISEQTGQADPLDADLMVFERASDGLLRSISIGQLKTEIGAGGGTSGLAACDSPTEVTIASGDLDLTGIASGCIAVDTEADAASDDVATIQADAGTSYTFVPANGARTVVFLADVITGVTRDLTMDDAGDALVAVSPSTDSLWFRGFYDQNMVIPAAGFQGDTTTGSINYAHKGSVDGVGGAFEIEQGDTDQPAPSAGRARIIKRASDGAVVVLFPDDTVVVLRTDGGVESPQGFYSTGGAGQYCLGDGTGSERLCLKVPATLSTNRECQFVDGAAVIPASCLVSSANVQSILGAADYAAIRTLLGLVIGTNVQAFDADLSTYAGIPPSANVQAILAAANHAAVRTLLGLVIGTNVQAFDADLSTYAGIPPSANVQSILGAADYAAIRTLLGLVIGTNVQAFDADLSTYAGLPPSANVQTLLGAANFAAFRTSLAVPNSIASGTAALGTGAITSGTCATVVTVSATGTATTDTIHFTPNSDITGVTGYAPVTTGGLAIYPYPTTNNVNFKVCNPTASSITPGAVTLNWRVTR